MTFKFSDEKYVLLGDTHIGARSDSGMMHDRFELFFNFMFEYMKSNGLKTIVQFGDLFDRRKFVNFISLNRGRKYLFDKLRENNFHMVVLIGNHDIPYKNTLEANSPSLLLQEYADCISIIQEPTELGLGSTSALVLPWICDDNEIEAIQAITDTKSPLCFGHLELAGFEMYKGAVCEHGLSKDLFWKFDHVYSGHFHHISSKDNITYLGSPYQITWADHGDERGFFVLNTNDLSTDFVENPFSNFYKISYDDKADPFSVEDIEARDFSCYNKTFVKVIVSNKTNLYVFDKFIEALENAGAIVHTVDDHKYKNIVTDEEIAEGGDDVNDIFEKVSLLYAEVTDADKLKTYFVELYNEALNTSQV